MAFAAPALTMAGKTLLHKGLAGETIKFTRLKMGDGSLTTQNPAELTDLIHTVTEIDIETMNRKDNYVSIRGIFSNQSLSAGFYWREFGLFAQDPDKGEILYCYSNAGDLAEYITSADASEIVKKLTMSVAISDVQDIVLVADDSIVFATLDDLDALEQSVNASITNITQVIQQVTGVDPSDPDAEPPSGSMVVTLTHAKTGTVHAFTGLGDRTGLVPCQFKSAAGYTEGDTATIDGVDYTITLTGADAPETDLFVSGKSILVDVDTESKTINFKAGGGLTKGKLALANATEDVVFAGRTFYAGADKIMRTGRALSQETTATAGQILNGFTAYNNNGTLLTGAALATPITATTDDVNPGVTYYDETGTLRTGTRKKTVQTAIYQMNDTFTVPAGITSIAVRIFGGGGGGSVYGGGGGGHMAYGEFAVTPGQQIPVTIGLGGSSGAAGGTSSFGTLLSAAGGSAGSINGGGSGGSGGGGTVGGNGSYGGGGGSEGIGQNGGNGGTYGGGGGGTGGYVAVAIGNNRTIAPGTGGTGGTYGGKGGNGGAASASGAVGSSGSNGSGGTNTNSMNLEFKGSGSGGSGKAGFGYTSGSTKYRYGGPGGGGGGYGGNGGSASLVNDGYHTVTQASGGGGGYGAAGGNGHAAMAGGNVEAAAGGGGGYGGKGGDGYIYNSSGSNGESYAYVYPGGGGGYGTQGKGGSKSSGSGAGANGGIAAGGSGAFYRGSPVGGSGGNGICIVTYLE